jgi:hypothetical protein
MLTARRGALRIGLIALVLVCAGCGSTVSEAERAATPAGDYQQGLGPAGGGPTSGGPGSFVPGSGSGSVPGTGGLGGLPTLPGGNRSGVRVPGLTSNAVYIGATFQQDQGSTNAGIFGAGNLDTGDARDYFNAVIGEINAAGGLAGRRLIPVYAEIKAASKESIDQQFQAACETWNRDSPHGVFAIAEAGRGVVRECALKAGAAQFGEETSSIPETFRRYPNYVEISGMNLVRGGPVTIGGLAREGYFEPGARIGIVSWDEPLHRTAVRDGYLPALRSRGLSLAIEPAYVRVPESAQDIGRTSADVSAAVLRFSSQDITHVLLLEGQAGVCAPGCLTAIFMREADGQRYRPRYGLNNDNEPVAGDDGGLYPASQLRRSVAVVWRAYDEAADAGIAPNAARARCFALMRRHGITFSTTNPNARVSALAACGTMWFMQAAFARMTGPVTVANFMDGVHRLGRSYLDPIVYGTFYAPTRHDGIAAVRNARFNEDCDCFKYTTGAYAV